MRLFRQLLCFLLFFTLQVRIVDASSLVIPAEDPEDCIRNKMAPCALSTGDQPRMFNWGEANWELDRNLVLQKEAGEKPWTLYQGLLVVNAKENLKIHTPFADILLEKSKAMIHVMKDRVRILCLDGRGLRVKPKADTQEHFLVPGFQNWFGSDGKGGASSGVVSVFDFEDFAQKRAQFFMDHQLGFVRELGQVARVVKWAARLSAKINAELVERKFASLEAKHQEKIMRKRRGIQFNKFLRRLFLQKIRYDY